MVSANSRSSDNNEHIQCVICYTEINNPSSSLKLYKLCTKHLHSGIAKENQDDCELEGEGSSISLCRQCWRTATELEELTTTEAFFRKRVSDMVSMFTLEILHRRGKVSLQNKNPASAKKLIQFDVSKLPDSDSWSFPSSAPTGEVHSEESQDTNGLGTGEVHSEETQDTNGVGGPIIKVENVGAGSNDLENGCQEAIEIDLTTDVEVNIMRISNSSDPDPMRPAPCATVSPPPPEEQQEKRDDGPVSHLCSDLDENEGIIETQAMEKNSKSSTKILTDDNVGSEANESVTVTPVENFECVDQGETGANDLEADFKSPDIVEIELLDKTDQLSITIEKHLRDVLCTSSEAISLSIEKHGNIADNETLVTETMERDLDIIENNNCGTSIRTRAVVNGPKVSIDTNNSEISTKDVVQREPIALTANNDAKNVAEKCDKNKQHTISLPFVKLERLWFNWKPKDNDNGQEVICLDDGAWSSKANPLPKGKTHLKSESEESHQNNPNVVNSEQIPSTSTSSSIASSILLLSGNSKEDCGLGNMQGVPKTKKTRLNCQLARDSDQENSYQNRKPKSKRGTGSERHSLTNRPFKCTSCKKSYALKWILDMHNRIHNGIKPFNCYFCDKDCYNFGWLNSHMRSHTGEKPHICPSCGKSFAQKSNLTTHLRTHSAEVPFATVQ